MTIDAYRIYVKAFFSIFLKKIQLILVNKFVYDINDIVNLVSS